MEKPVSPLVSVLLASYNHEAYVEASVRSVMAQKGVDFELVVIDDGSSDSSPEILSRLQSEFGFTYVHRPNKGLIGTMNELLALAKGKYFCTFASDDIMPPDRLCKQSSYLAAHPGNVACFGQVVPMSKEGVVAESRDPRYLKSVPEVSFEQSFLGQKALHGCSEMFVTEKIRAVGGYDSRFFFEDYPLYLKILYNYGTQPVSSDFDCCYYREHGDNMHENHDRIYSEILRILEDYKSHPLYKKAVNSWKANWFSTLAYQDKKVAFKRVFELGSFSFLFFKRLVKIFVPKFLLKY